MLLIKISKRSLLVDHDVGPRLNARAIIMASHTAAATQGHLRTTSIELLKKVPSKMTFRVWAGTAARKAAVQRECRIVMRQYKYVPEFEAELTEAALTHHFHK